MRVPFRVLDPHDGPALNSLLGFVAFGWPKP